MKLAERDPEFQYPRRIAARAYVEARLPGSSETALRRGFEMQPDSPAPFRELADFYLELDRGGDAVTVCRQGLERFAGDVELERLLARASLQLGDRGGAIQEYEAIRKTQPDDDEAPRRPARQLVTVRRRETPRERARGRAGQ